MTRAQASCHPPGQETGIQAADHTADSQQPPDPAPPTPGVPPSGPHPPGPDGHAVPAPPRTTTPGLLNTTPAEHLIAAARDAAGNPANPHPAQGPTTCQPAQITRFGRCEISQVTAARCARTAVTRALAPTSAGYRASPGSRLDFARIADSAVCPERRLVAM